MKCKACGEHATVCESRERRDGSVRRRRKCDVCGARMTTVECVVDSQQGKRVDAPQPRPNPQPAHDAPLWQRIAYERKRRGIGKKRLADEAGCEPSTLAKIESGAPSSRATIYAIAAVLGIPLRSRFSAIDGIDIDMTMPEGLRVRSAIEQGEDERMARLLYGAAAQSATRRRRA